MSTLSPVFTLAVCRTSSGRITAGLLPDEVIFLLSLRSVASESLLSISRICSAVKTSSPPMGHLRTFTPCSVTPLVLRVVSISLYSASCSWYFIFVSAPPVAPRLVRRGSSVSVVGGCGDARRGLADRYHGCGCCLVGSWYGCFGSGASGAGSVSCERLTARATRF